MRSSLMRGLKCEENSVLVLKGLTKVTQMNGKDSSKPKQLYFAYWVYFYFYFFF